MKTNICKSAALVTFITAGAIGTLSLPVQAVESVTLQLATIASPGNVWLEAAQKFSDGVAERTDGKVSIQISHSGTTGSVRESVEALQIGTNDIVQTVIASLEPYDDLAAIESYPYLIRDEAHFDKVFNGPVGEELYDAIGQATGFKLIGAGFRGAREMASKKAVNTLSDLHGIKMRVPEIPVFRRTWESLGASPIPMSSKEVYTALNEGIIDAVENPLEAHIRSRYYEAADYVIMTNHVYGAYTFLFSDGRFASFSPELRAILEEEGRKAMQWGGEQTKKEIEGYKTQLQAHGVTILSPELSAFREELKPLAGEFPKLKPWIEKIAAVE
uniref:TRAP transporter substrate-binding protein n=1 Tax=Marinobacterium profundum TaxID=1714300 RepID=UPI00082EAA16|nr:TRAP transporter substrate-binding protein [Marinobacterium profundum]